MIVRLYLDCRALFSHTCVTLYGLSYRQRNDKLYYYVVESARVDGKPRIVHQTYLGTADKVAALVGDRTAPVPLEATAS